jgi:hypothetical protein
MYSNERPRTFPENCFFGTNKGCVASHVTACAELDHPRPILCLRDDEDIWNLIRQHRLVAEGVETEEQSRLLRLLNCDEFQGYLFSKPVPREIFETRFLAHHNLLLVPGNSLTD